MESYLSDIQDVRASICQVYDTFKGEKTWINSCSIGNILGIYLTIKHVAKV